MNLDVKCFLMLVYYGGPVSSKCVYVCVQERQRDWVMEREPTDGRTRPLFKLKEWSMLFAWVIRIWLMTFKVQDSFKQTFHLFVSLHTVLLDTKFCWPIKELFYYPNENAQKSMLMERQWAVNHECRSWSCSYIIPVQEMIHIKTRVQNT